MKQRLINPLFIGFFVLIAQLIQAQAAKLIYDLTEPVEADKWQLTVAPGATATSGYVSGAMQAPCVQEQMTALEREVEINTELYDRVIIELEAIEGKTPNGFFATAFFFGNHSNIIRESRFLGNLPERGRTQLAFELEQSVFWTGTVRKIRLDPMWATGIARVYSITFDQTPKADVAPSWDFRTKDGKLDWTIGEFSNTDLKFMHREVSFEPDGMLVTSQESNPVMQAMNFRFNAADAQAVEVELKVPSGRPSASRFYWAYPDDLAIINERMIELPIQQGGHLQKLRFDLSRHPAWKGQIGFLLFNPILQPGKVIVKNMRFIQQEGLGRKGQQDSLIVWKNHQEVGRELDNGNYKPLLILITKKNNSFSQKIEKELANNQRFLDRTQNFHPVHLDYEDPVTSKVFDDIYRVPTLATMRYDFNRKKWDIQDRLAGSEVSTRCLEVVR